ncbi:hypothetical protein EIN_209300 [Entamoeba invadens IP1]|uniref:Uncharacterized protein n=1 Tax=Entamoeba invadens IP1 TaxID=370355 RepID=L7FNM0_ENTIV|nr:hypothetical protein EIN_209300 [Entamoeba invadens IP1]ELP94511.1 hypothetical protein EIN_209300 [Entamoeba invadens IP1]|eukprot:XP_004261282.1 hypothetical protein EIN_209300 [Entamoeba invadens IP1]
MNILFYIVDETTLITFRLINKKCQDSIFCLKVNPRTTNLNINFLFVFFPRLNTLTGNLNLICNSLTLKQLNQISWFDTSNMLTDPTLFDQIYLDKIITIKVDTVNFEYVHSHCPKVRKIVLYISDTYTIPSLKFSVLKKLILKKRGKYEQEVFALEFSNTNPDTFIGFSNVYCRDIKIDNIHKNNRFSEVHYLEECDGEFEDSDTWSDEDSYRENTLDYDVELELKSKINAYFAENTPLFTPPVSVIKNCNKSTLDIKSLKRNKIITTDASNNLFNVEITIDNNTLEVLDFSNFDNLKVLRILLKKSVATEIRVPDTEIVLPKLIVFEVVSKSQSLVNFIGTRTQSKIEKLNIQCPIKSIELFMESNCQIILFNTGIEEAKIKFYSPPKSKLFLMKGKFNLKTMTFGTNGIVDVCGFKDVESLTKVVFAGINDKNDWFVKPRRKKVWESVFDNLIEVKIA